MKDKSKKKEEVKSADCLKGLIVDKKTDTIDMVIKHTIECTRSILNDMYGINLNYYPVEYKRGLIYHIIKNDPSISGHVYTNNVIEFNDMIDVYPDLTYIIHDELLVLLIYAFFDKDQTCIMQAYIHALMTYTILPAYIFKLWTINKLPESEAEIFKTCQQMIIDDGLLYNNDYKSSCALKHRVLYSVFHDKSYIERLEKIYPNYHANILNNYVDMMDDMLKKVIPAICDIDRNLTAFHKKLNHITEREQVDEARKVLENFDEEKLGNTAVQRLSLLCDLIYDLFDIFDEVMDEACKKYPEIADNLRNLVSFEADTIPGIINNQICTSKEVTSLDDSICDLIDLKQTALESIASTYSFYSRFKGGNAPITFNIDVMIEYIIREYNFMSYDQLINNLRITMKHEFGHAIAHIFDILRYDDEDYLFASVEHSQRIKDLEMKRREDNPNIAILHYSVWYYSYLPEERLANKYMDISIEDILIADGEEITPEIRADIDSINIEQIMIEEQKMLLEL